MEIKQKYTFSGHESFQCRQFWLKKGFDYVLKGKSFNDEDAVVELGVGKNMVNSIRYWMKAFNLTSNDDKVTEFASKLFSDKGGYDPYLEDEASLWLLHYQLVKKGYASTYSLVFNRFRKEKIEFTKDNYISFIKREAEGDKSIPVNEKTLLEDFAVMTKMYLRSNPQIKDKEDSFSGLLTELDLIKQFNSKGKEDLYLIENSERPEIPFEVILFSILDSCIFDTSINLNTIEYEINSVCSIFALNRTGILSKIEAMTSKYDVVFNDQAGIKELQFKMKPTAISILDNYYAN